MSKLEFVAKISGTARWVFCLESGGDNDLFVRVNKEASLEHIHDWLRTYCFNEVGQPVSIAEDSLVRSVLSALGTWDARALVTNREAVMERLECDSPLLSELGLGKDEDGNAVDAERETAAV